jgi:hypothetical protein
MKRYDGLFSELSSEARFEEFADQRVVRVRRPAASMTA